MSRRPFNKRMLASKAPIGTEALALKNMTNNGRDFHYPDTGFVTPIEHSLLYATLSQPTLFPPDVIKNLIADEDFSQYLAVRLPEDKSIRSLQQQQRAQQSPNATDEGSSPPSSPSSSYAQLSAILNLAAEEWPADSEVPKVLCKALLQCIVQHAETHDLDRESEVRELMLPLLRLNERRAGKNALATLLPMYIGLGVSMITLNPAGLWAGYAIGNYYNIKSAVQDGGRQKKIQTISTEVNRAGDLEQASLLDETEHT
jgi:hypothetical protein